jgi:hypothetical protein
LYGKKGIEKKKMKSKILCRPYSSFSLELFDFSSKAQVNETTMMNTVGRINLVKIRPAISTPIQ